MEKKSSVTFWGRFILLFALISGGIYSPCEYVWSQSLTPSVTSQFPYRFIGPDGNRAIAVAGVPGNPKIAYVGAASGGIFKTTDGGVHWSPIFDAEKVSSVGSLAITPGASNIVWAGTGETFFIRGATSIGNGIYKSTNSGRTWKNMGLPQSGRIGRIVVDPENTNIVFAAAEGSGFKASQHRGVYRTTDGGKTWKRVLFVDEHTGCIDLSMDPDDPNTIFAAMWQLEVRPWNLKSGGPGSGIWVSHDGGNTWHHIVGHGLPTHPVGKIAVQVAPSNPERVYALIEDKDPGFYRSDDGGKNWYLVSNNHTMDERAPYYTRFAVAPDNENQIYFVSVRFSMSLDGGATLVKNPPYGGGDNHDVWIDPKYPERIMVASDGGASISLNRGKTFQYVNLPIAQMYHVYTDNKIPYNVYGNRQDGYSYMGPSNSLQYGISIGLWHSVGGCESGFTIPDTVAGNISWSGCYDGGLERYDNNTRQTRNVRIWPEAGYGWPPKDLKYRWNWTFPIAISPFDHHKVYAGSQKIHETTDGGQSWKIISPDLTKDDISHEQTSGGVATDNLMTFDGATLWSIAESPVEKGLIWVGSNDGLVHMTRDDGQHWENVTHNIPNLPPWGTISNFEPSRFHAGTAYISVDLHMMGNDDPYIYKTSDYGRHWSLISSGIPESVFSYVHVVKEDPHKEGLLYAGTENSVYYSLNDGKTWNLLQNNLPHAPAYWLTIQPDFDDLVVATYGRGFWIMDDVSPLEQLNDSILASDVHLFNPRVAYRFRNVVNTSSLPNATVYGQNPRYGADINYYLKTAATKPVTIIIRDSDGDTIRTLRGKNEPGINRVWWNLRYPNPKQPRLLNPPPDKPFVKTDLNGRRIVSWDLDLSQRAPLAPPGEYTILLKVGNKTYSKKLKVLKDPHSTGNLEDIDEQVKLSLKIRKDFKSLANLIDNLEWMRRQLNLLTKRLDTQGPGIDEVIEAADSLKSGLTDVEGQLFDIHLTGAREDAFRNPMRLYGRYSALNSDVTEKSADFQPTDQQQEVFTVLHKRLLKVQEQFDQFKMGQLNTFNLLLSKHHLSGIISGK